MPISDLDRLQWDLKRAGWSADPRQVQYIADRLEEVQLAAYGFDPTQDAHVQDANETAFVPKQLEVTRPESYDVIYGTPKFRQYIPIDTSVPNWADTVKYLQFDELGEVAVVSEYADDLPLVDTLVKEFIGSIRPLAVAYRYTIDELRKSAALGMPLDARRGRIARRVLERAMDKIAAVGNPGSDTGLVGAGNNTNVPTFTAAGTWASATAENMLADLHGWVGKVLTGSKGEFDVTDLNLLLDAVSYDRIRAKHMGTGDPGKTVLSTFKEQSSVKGLEIWDRLATAGPASAKRGMAYVKNTDMLHFIESQPFEQLAPQERGFAIYVACHARCGGVEFPYPISAVYIDGHG